MGMLNINPDLIQQIQQGAISTNDLVLQKKMTGLGRMWELKLASKETDSSLLSLHSMVVDSLQGNELVEILRRAANGEALPEKLSDLSGKSKAKLMRFSRSIPGMESPKTTQARKKVKDAIVRIKEPLGQLMKGTSEYRAEGKPWRVIQTDYVIAELMMKGSPLTANEVQNLASQWKVSNTTLGFVDWVKAVEDEWKSAHTDLEFIPWVNQKNWQEREVSAWKAAHPGVEFSSQRISEWRATQYDPKSLLSEPTWLLRSMWEKEVTSLRNDKKPEPSFDEWVAKTVEGRKTWWVGLPRKSRGIVTVPTIEDKGQKTLDDKAFKELEALAFKYDITGSSLDFDVWVAKQQWLATKPKSTSQEAFKHHLDYKKYMYAIRKKGPDSMSFDRWKSIQKDDLERTWKASKTPLSFKDWKLQQYRDPVAPVPFIRLNATDRQAYSTNCDAGVLKKGNKPFATTHEQTAHSGKGWVIFVIGHKDELYTGSHLPGVFHHSSFLGDAAVTAAGEIKTNNKGKITHISSKSGHYKPTEKENIATLKWFEARGVNLSEVMFTYFTADGEADPIKADLYLAGVAARIKGG